MRASLPLSFLLHAGAVYAMVHVWTPSDDNIDYVPAVPIEVISEAELAELISVPEEVKVEEPAEIVEVPALPEEVEETPTTPEEQPTPPPAEEDPPPVEDVPAEIVEEDKPEIDPPQEKPPEEPPEPPQQEETEEDLLGDLSDSLNNLDPNADDRKRPAEVTADAIGSDRNIERIGEGRELTITEETRFQSWLERCWQPVTGTPDPEKLIVKLQIRFNITGEVQDIKVMNNTEISLSGNRYWNASKARAIAAANECSPFEFLDPARYDNWQVVNFQFTPPY